MHSPEGSIAAVRGAITVPTNSADAIRAATTRLLNALTERNSLERSSIVSAIFTATPDLDADFPAHAARALGWSDVPLLCAQEIPVPGALPRTIRVLLTVGGVAPGRRLVPAYLEDAARLRPDLAAPARDGHGTLAHDPPPGPRTRVALIGLGQIGGSIGLALAGDSSFRRIGFDADSEVAGRALAGGALDEVAATLAGACSDAALAVVAVPVDVLPRTLDAVALALPRGAALLDTGSARTGVTPALERAAAGGIAAVGGHPIAGNEGSGLASARADLFRGATFALCPVGGDVPDIALRLALAVGATPRIVEPKAHDSGLARTSHLPYVVACALEAIGRDAARAGLSGPGFRDMTRLAASDPRVAGAYCRANAREIAAAWSELRVELDRRIAALADQPPATGTALNAAT